MRCPVRCDGFRSRRPRKHEDVVVIDVPFHLYGTNGNGKNGASRNGEKEAGGS